MPDRIPTGGTESAATHTELDTIVLHIELTLISIIQAVALTILVERSYPVLVGLKIIFWPYIVTGVLTILIFWSRALLHTLTVIRWPLDLTHNFMYIACTLVEAVTFTQLTDVFHWYALNALFALMVWVLFVLDLGMIRHRISDSSGPVGGRLYAIVEREQLLSIRLFMPATVVFNLCAMLAVRSWNASLVQQGGHVIVGLLQMAAALGYLLYVMRFFGRVVPLIAKTRQEWREDVLP